jgi:peptidoglycan/xylan/chitin deacetylase (PgdA/CDA1 family)
MSVDSDGSESGRTLVLTFDNLGEASELERGTWPAQAPLGRHPSVLKALPRLLDALDTLGLRATFFVEAINCELYPEAVRGIAVRGHELGMHGWRHERWRSLSESEECAALARGVAAFAALGVEVQAFRPPGGELTPCSVGHLREHGFRWCSPVGMEPWRRDGLDILPFTWELVDAYHLMASFAELRVAHGDAPEPAAAEAIRARLELALADRRRHFRTLILHPFLMLEDSWWAGARAVLALAARMAGEGECWVGPGGEYLAGATRP